MRDLASLEFELLCFEPDSAKTTAFIAVEKPQLGLELLTCTEACDDYG